MLVSGFGLLVLAQTSAPVFTSKAYSIYPDKVIQGNFTAHVLSPVEMTSDYRSPEADKCSPTVEFKFGINCRDNEMAAGKNHIVTLRPVNGKCVTTVVFGKQQNVIANTKLEEKNLPKNTQWTIRLDMRNVLNAFKEKGYFTLSNGDKLYESDFKSVYVAGSTAPLLWDFHNLFKTPELQLKDLDGDGIFETTLVLNTTVSDDKITATHWKLSKGISAFPSYSSPYPVSDAVYNLAVAEMVNAVEPDSTFRTGKEWAGVWTRDISYSIILSMAVLQPKVAEYSLLRKVKDGRIIQDTGTGGAYPASTDRMIWAVAAWELYKTSGDKQWLNKAYAIIKKSMDDDVLNAYDGNTGLVRGESSFLDWREQTYPRWMQPADIYDSENLGTNAVHFKANEVLAEMAALLGDNDASAKYRHQAEKIKNGINRYLWMPDKGYYGQYLYGREYKMLSPRSEALGEALSVWFGIAGDENQKSVVENTPVTAYGISCIYPQIPDLFPYHNNAVWPFVQAYWGIASAKAGNEKSVMESMAAIYRPATLFLTNKENMVADNGDFAGTQINSSNMLWSLSGSIAMVYRVLFGMEYTADKLEFHPFVPKALTGNRSLTRFKYRNAVLNISMEGSGNQITSFLLDGKETNPEFPASLAGVHEVKIRLSGNDISSKINKRDNYTAPETPEVKYIRGMLKWEKIPGATSYKIIKNGKPVATVKSNIYTVKPMGFAEYQVISLDKNGVPSFASDPVMVAAAANIKTLQMEKFAPASGKVLKNFEGTGYIEISKTENRLVSFPVQVANAGDYSVSFRYANGNGPVNTENKCAIRTLKANDTFAGTIIFPQRGTNEWSNWGFTNGVKVSLKKGENIITLSFETANENMNGEINQAMIDAVRIIEY